MIQESDILCLHFYDYNMPFTGSDHNMRYRIIKKVEESEKEEKIETFEATIWPGPYAYDHTDASLKVKKEFPFTKEGEREVVAWLNDEYDKNYS